MQTLKTKLTLKGGEQIIRNFIDIQEACKLWDKHHDHEEMTVTLIKASEIRQGRENGENT